VFSVEKIQNLNVDHSWLINYPYGNEKFADPVINNGNCLP